jgi:ABC-type phosphate/phosphonate transport system substrate-binding protein
MLVASLPMYDWPEIRPYTDEFWAGLARYGLFDTALARRNYRDVWHQSELIFSQTCGYPFTHEFKGLLQYVATPHYAADGCDGANYCSIIFARDEQPLPEFFGATVAINSTDSMSGMLAMKVAIAPFLKSGEFFKRCKISGSHRNSLAAVQSHFADICAVDSVCVGLAKKHCPETLEGLVEISRTVSVPGLPYVTRAGDPAALVTALKNTFADPSLAAAREALLLKDFSVLAPNAYDKITELEAALPDFEL